jgi:MYXO-CTERM domain-containing protein
MSLGKRCCNALRAGAAIGAIALTSTASAAPATTYQLVADCDQAEDDCGPQDENAGPGFEQAKGDWFVGPSGNPWVGYVVMSSKAVPNRDDGPYQCRYYAWEIDPTQGPVTKVDGVLLTQNRGDRPCNHPDVQFIGGTDMLFCFGTNDDNENEVQTYAQILDATTGTPKSARTQLTDGDGNDGAGTCQALKTGATLESLQVATTYPKRFVLCHNDNGNNADCVVADAQADGSVARVAQIDDVIDPANIPRPHMVQITTDGKFAVTAAKGDERPPEDGAYMRIIDVVNPQNGNDGNMTEQMPLMQSAQEQNLYANSPELHAPGPLPGTFWAMNITSKSNGREDKGTSNYFAHVVRFNASMQLEVVSTLPGAGHYQAHAAMCTSTHGPDGVPAGIIVESSISNSGPAVVTPVYYGQGAAQAAIIEGPTKVGTPWSGDSGHLANLYGNNPNTQGRDFVDCIGSVPNPGFGQTEGFQAETQSFIVVPSYGKMAETDYKNSFFLSFIPAHTPNQVLPPDDPGKPPEEPGDGGDDDGAGDDGPSSPSGSGATSGCSTSGSGGGAALILIAGALLVLRRRRTGLE